MHSRYCSNIKLLINATSNSFFVLAYTKGHEYCFFVKIHKFPKIVPSRNEAFNFFAIFGIIPLWNGWKCTRLFAAYSGDLQKQQCVVRRRVLQCNLWKLPRKQTTFATTYAGPLQAKFSIHYNGKGPSINHEPCGWFLGNF